MTTAPSQNFAIDVTCIGHALVDVLAGATDEFLATEDLDKGSMRLIDSDRAQALYNRMGPGSEASGGSSANTSTGIAACGGTAAFVGTTADDQLGEIFAHDLRAAGVTYRTAPAQNVPPTGRCMILVTPDGERTMNTYLGAAAAVGPQFEDAELIEAASIVYVEGYVLDTEYTIDDMVALADRIHANGGRLAFTLSDTFLVQRHREDVLRMLEGSVDICFGNEDEVIELFGSSNLDDALNELSKRCEVLAITKGAAGSVLVSNGERVEVEALKVNVVDTTGAGDLYAAGVLVGLANGWPLERCGRMGSAAAGAVISQMGARLTRELRPVQ